MKRLIATQMVLVGGILLMAAALTPTLAQQQQIPLQVGLNVSIHRVPFIIAFEEGIYARNGLDVDQFISRGTAESVRRDGITVNPQYVRPGESTPLTTAAGRGSIINRATNASFPQDVIILATIDPVMRGHIVAQPEITRLEQLKGKRLGYTSFAGRTRFVALVLADRMGWDPVQDISLMSNTRMDTFKDRRVDAIIANENRYAAALAAGFKPLFNLRSWDVPVVSTGVTTTRSWLRDNRETARRFIKSLVEGIAVFKKDKEVAFRAMAKWWGITDPQTREMIYAAAAETPSKPYPAVEGIKKAMQLHDSNEMRKYKAEDFYDDSLVRELDESGFIDGLYR